MTWLRLVPYLAFPVLAHAQGGQSTAAPPFSAAKGAFFAVSVADIDASTRWYSEKLGLRVVMRAPKQDKSAVTVLEGGGLIVELLQREDAQPLTKAAPGVSANYLVYGVFKAGIIVDDFDGTMAALKARGVEIVIGPFAARDKQRANAIVRDNSGNLIQIFGPR